MLVINYYHGSKIKKAEIYSDPRSKHVLESILKFLQVNLPHGDLSYLTPEEARPIFNMEYPYKFPLIMGGSIVGMSMLIMAFLIHNYLLDVPLGDLLLLMLLIFIDAMIPTYLIVRILYRSK